MEPLTVSGREGVPSEVELVLTSNYLGQPLIGQALGTSPERRNNRKRPALLTLRRLPRSPFHFLAARLNLTPYARLGANSVFSMTLSTGSNLLSSLILLAWFHINNDPWPGQLWAIQFGRHL